MSNNNKKKKLKLTKEETVEMTYEEMIKRYNNYIIKTVSNMVDYVHRKYEYLTILCEYEDIKQVGLLAAYDAYRKYDYNYGYSFFTILKCYIEGRILTYIRTLSKEHRKEYKDLMHFEISLEKKNKDEVYPKDIIVDDSINVEEEILHEIGFKDLLNMLPEEYKPIIDLRYRKLESQASIAKKLGSNQTKICRMEKKALNKLKESIESSQKESGVI
ncbi:MAG: sigma-70 family RNA polymerase sigma factor [Terrisporobacter sp.]|uniref:sigma-70 family RNA polymerase sigma factor n=1 Tax=Terrisporobacter sp. TaxID=1965305 RepID=UPI002A90CB7D|nr:sigma-70 family RNA polymerase sigma factor [Terrisporobacter sp.]MDY6152210.1 sigma-70 family RNA polymerase sigma factor [Terrisporobacter sp.]